MRKVRLIFGSGCILLLLLGLSIWSQPTTGKKDNEKPVPAKFDLRTVNGVTPVKKQFGGTCWTHGTMAAIESNLILSGVWKASGLEGYPAVSEYHLDWWNGFNKHKNIDLEDPAKDKTGLKVHDGGDFRVAAAYMSRGDGVVLVPRGPDNALLEVESWYKKAPTFNEPRYKRFYVRDIEWFVVGDNLENIDLIKRRIMKEGAMGTAYAASKWYISKDFVHYQPPSSRAKQDHAVAIAGWDDDKISAEEDKKAPKPGAWLIKNSWGTGKGDKGYYWISYYDKHCGRDPEMGAVSFRNIEPMAFDHIYYHDYHGWRDTLKNVSKAFNAFTASANHRMKAVSFYTAKDNVTFTVKLFSRFEKGQLSGELGSKTGTIPYTGFHTVNLDKPIDVKEKTKFYVYLDLSDGGQAIDRTSVVPVLLGEQKAAPGLPVVISKANAGESYHWDGSGWKDLYDYKFENPEHDRTANFCMKALAVNVQAREQAERRATTAPANSEMK